MANLKSSHQQNTQNIIIVLLTLFAIGLFAPVHFVIDIINHCRPFLLIAFFVLCIFLFYKDYRHRHWIWVFSVFALNIHTPTIPAKHTLENDAINIMHFNLLITNQNHDAVLKAIKLQDPDIVSFQEATHTWTRFLKSKLPQYRFVCHERNTPFGICAALRIPIIKESVFFIQSPDVPALYIQAKPKHSQTLALVFAHPKPPFQQSFFRQRNEFFEKLIPRIQNEKNLILVGDLNTTQWSPIYQDLENRLGLKNTLWGLGNTWPTFSPLPLFQLDHILIAKHLLLKNATVLENIGSDHYPIAAEIYVPKDIQ